jgi:predicted dehydrogenase
LKADRILRGALVGAGTIAPYHLTAWSHTPGVEIVAICNRTLEKAHALARRFDIAAGHVYGDLNSMLTSERNLDFVDVVTAPDLHRRHVEIAAGHGVNVLCQKPFAPSLADACAMIDACSRAGVLLSINENWRWRSWYRTIRDLVADDGIGTLRYVRIATHRNGTLGLLDGREPAMLTRQPFMRHMPCLIVLEWAIHLIDTLRMLVGEPNWVHASMMHVSPHVAGEDRALMTFGFGEMVASIDVSWATIGPEELPTLLEEVVIEGDLGSIALVPNRGDGDLIRIVRRLPEDRLPVDKERPWSPVMTTVMPAHDGDIAAAYQASYDAAHAHFAECLRSGRLPETNAVDNLKTLRAVFAAYESAAENRIVSIPEDR